MILGFGRSIGSGQSQVVEQSSEGGGRVRLVLLFVCVYDDVLDERILKRATEAAELTYVGARHGDEEVGEVVAGDVGVPGSGALSGDDDGRFEFLLEESLLSFADEEFCVVWLEVN